MPQGCVLFNDQQVAKINFINVSCKLEQTIKQDML